MKLLKIALSLACIFHTKHFFANASYGNIIEVDNQYEGSLYIVSTDPTPGKFNTAPGCQVSEVPARQNVKNDTSAKFYVPWENTGGKIYVWLKNKQGKIVTAARLYDKDDIIYFEKDIDLAGQSNVVDIQIHKADCQQHTMHVRDVHLKLTATLKEKYNVPIDVLGGDGIIGSNANIKNKQSLQKKE